MELATGPLPPRPPAAPPTEDRADAWGEFLRRVLVLVGPAGDARTAATESPPGGALPHSPALAGHGIGLTAE